jgi:hypothetical protein
VVHISTPPSHTSDLIKVKPHRIFHFKGIEAVNLPGVPYFSLYKRVETCSPFLFIMIIGFVYPTNRTHNQEPCPSGNPNNKEANEKLKHEIDRIQIFIYNGCKHLPDQINKSILWSWGLN